MPLFSIIIPVYNVQNYLSACVKSVVEQPGPRDWECILVDDGSTDQSGAMCDALAAELPGLKVIHRENGGLAAARNTGLKAATGDWLLFLDSDDAMAPGLLAQLRGALAAHPDCDWFIGKHLEWQPDGTLTPHDGLHLGPVCQQRLRRTAEGPVHCWALVGLEILHPAVLFGAGPRPLPAGLRLGRGLAL